MTARSTVLSVLAVMLVVLAAFTGCSSGPATTTGIAQPPSPQELEASGFLFPELPRITAEGLKHMIDTGEPVVVVDTRLPMFFNGGHIPESVNIPIVTSGDLEDPQGFNDLPKDRAIVFYCDWPDDEWSAGAADRLLEMDLGIDPDNILILWKGYFAWQEKGYSFVR